MKIHLLAAAFAAAFAALVTGCSASVPDTDWASYGLNETEQRHSKLDQIDRSNVDGLGLVWAADLREGRGVEATPLMIGRTLYVTSAWSLVYAFDAVTGAEKWVYDPKVDRTRGASACCDVVNRGLAYKNGNLFLATIDGRLISIDAKSGQPNWDVQTIVDLSKPYAITGAPRVAGDLVLIGNSGADLGVRGYVTAYRQDTGAKAWRFYTVPGNPANGPDGEASDPILAKAAKTWFGQWWREGGGGTVWDSITYDPELDRVYIGVGNGAPWNRQIRSKGKGDNWFLASIVALDRKTGRYLWHYQVSPGDTWDATATQNIILADMVIEGKPRRVLMQAPKNGFFYVLDRQDGRLLSARNIVPMAKTADTPAGQPISWAYGIDMKSGRPLVNPEAWYTDGKPIRIRPTGMGAHSWQPMSYDPELGVAYIPIQDWASTFQHDAAYKPSANARASGLVAGGALPKDERVRGSLAKSINARLLAWDVRKQKPLWSVPHAFGGNGGTLATAGGLVFQSDGAGIFTAYDSATGKNLWSFDAKATAQGGPITYAIGGKQYIAIAVGNGGSSWLAGGITTAGNRSPAVGRVLVFGLDGRLRLPEAQLVDRPVPAFASFPAGNARSVGEGARLYAQYCAACHGFGAVSGGVTPDLRRSLVAENYDAFHSVVKEGALLQNGMPKFGPELPDQGLRAIQAYLADEANFLRQFGRNAR